MTLNEEIGAFGVEPGCAAHGDEHMAECKMCGTEFCRRCFPRATVCPDCADQSEDEEEEEDEPDFDDVKDLDEVLEDDKKEGAAEEEPQPNPAEEQDER